jgi:hypothetical protein
MRDPRFGQRRRQVLPHLKGVRSMISTRAQTLFTYTVAYLERRQARELIAERTQPRRPSPLRRRKRLRHQRQQRHRSQVRSPHHPQSPGKLRRSRQLHLRRLRRWQLRSRHLPSQAKLRQSLQLHLRPRFRRPRLLKPRLHLRPKLPLRQRSAWNRPPIRFQCHQRNHHQRRSRAARLQFR